MITLHREKETDFTKNGYGMLDDLIFNESGKWELNGEFMISFEVPALTRFTEYFKARNIIQAPVPYMDRQLFRIYRTEKTLQSIRVEARHIFYDLLDNWIEDTNIVGQFGNNAIQQLLRNTQYPHDFTGSSNIQQASNARVVRMNPVEALLDDGKGNSFVSRWGGELVRDNFFIEMLERRGTDRGVEIEHKKDLLGYEATIDISTVVTRVQPVGFDGLMLPERYVDSPLIDPEHPIIAEINYQDIKAAVGEYEDDEEAVPLEQAYDMLREAAKNEFESNHIDEPETVVNVDFVALHNTEQYKEFEQLQEVKAGDTVKVNVYDHVFEITSRLIAFDFSILKENHYTSTTLGNHVYEFTSSGVDVNDLRQRIEQAEQSAVIAMLSANGRNRNFFGQNNPNDIELQARVGDLFFRENGERRRMYRLVEVNGERYWKIETDTEDTEANKRAIEAHQKDIQDAKDSADTANQQINDAISNAGFTSLNDLTSDLKSTSDRTIQRIGDAEGNITQIESTVDGLQTTVASKADSSTVTQLADVVDTKVSNDDYQAQISTMADNINARVEKGDVMSQINIEAERTLIQSNRLYLDTQSVVFGGNAFIPNAAIESLSADKLTAGTIDAAQVNVINLDANNITGNRTEFVQSVWNGLGTTRIDSDGIQVLRANGGTYIGYDPDRWIGVTDRYEVGLMRKAVRMNSGAFISENEVNRERLILDSGQLIFINPGDGTTQRIIKTNSEGIEITPSDFNMGTDANTSIRLTGKNGSTGAHQYIDFNENPTSPNTRRARIEHVFDELRLRHPNDGWLRVRDRSNNADSGRMSVFAFSTHHSSGETIEMFRNRLQTPRTGHRDLFITPQGTGVVQVATSGLSYYNIRASNFLTSSARRLKTDIEEYTESALDHLNQLNIVEYRLKKDIEDGVDLTHVGLIAEESSYVSDGQSIDTYKLLSLNTKAIQELDDKQENVLKVASHAYLLAEQHEDELACYKKKIEELEEKVKRLEGVA